MDVDRIHLPIDAPGVCQERYVNRKGWHSVNCQITVDAKCRIGNIFGFFQVLHTMPMFLDEVHYMHMQKIQFLIHALFLLMQHIQHWIIWKVHLKENYLKSNQDWIIFYLHREWLLKELSDALKDDSEYSVTLQRTGKEHIYKVICICMYFTQSYNGQKFNTRWMSQWILWKSWIWNKFRKRLDGNT